MAKEEPEAAATSGKTETRGTLRLILGVVIFLVGMAIVGNFAFAILLLFWLGRIFGH